MTKQELIDHFNTLADDEQKLAIHCGKAGRTHDAERAWNRQDAFKHSVRVVRDLLDDALVREN